MASQFFPDGSRILIEADLKPLQGTRFQPTGFPDLGAATYRTADGTEMLLVESAQSVANRLEAVCWDEVAQDLVAPLRGLPYVRVVREGEVLTNSILEAHRLNSYYVENTDWFAKLKREIGISGKDSPVSLPALFRAVCKFDPCSLVHGTFLESIDGRLRVARVLSGFIEARGVQVVASGGAKVDRVSPKSERGSDGEESGRTSKEGVGNVIYHRDEFTAAGITAFFNIDLSQIRGYRLPDPMCELLTTLALWKVLTFLGQGLRLRTACDLDVAGPIRVTRPSGFELPSRAALETNLAAVITKAKGARVFADPPVTDVEFKAGKAKKGKGKKADENDESES